MYGEVSNNKKGEVKQEKQLKIFKNKGCKTKEKKIQFYLFLIHSDN